jgi:HKD family nuclease
MKFLYSSILPLGMPTDRESIADCFHREIEASDRVDIAVGYVSRASVEELSRLSDEYRNLDIHLTIGMYYVDGMPESSYHAAIALDEKLKQSGHGEVRIVKAFKYHGKLYLFYKNGTPFSCIIGSANLGVIKLEATNRRQYELSATSNDSEECAEAATFMQKINAPTCSSNIIDTTDMPLIREVNTSLTGIEMVSQIPQAEVDIYQHHKTPVSFQLPIKVPAFAERKMDDGKHFTKSNLNVSYAAPRSARKSRDWYETQFTVSKQITQLDGYPIKNVPFFVVTDDGYTFKAHTTSDGNKQFSAVGDELIMGRWIKGRLASAGLVTPVNDTQADTDRKGMITKEMLTAYGCNTIVLTKTNQKREDEEGALLDVWLLSFEAAPDDAGANSEEAD